MLLECWCQFYNNSAHIVCLLFCLQQLTQIGLGEEVLHFFQVLLPGVYGLINSDNVEHKIIIVICLEK